jgi:hypothetical protein
MKGDRRDQSTGTGAWVMGHIQVLVNKRPWLSGKEESSNKLYTHTHTDDDPAESRRSVEVFDSGKIRWAKTTLFLPPLSSFPPKFESSKRFKLCNFSEDRDENLQKIAPAVGACDLRSRSSEKLLMLRDRRSHAILRYIGC